MDVLFLKFLKLSGSILLHNKLIHKNHSSDTITKYVMYLLNPLAVLNDFPRIWQVLFY